MENENSLQTIKHFFINFKYFSMNRLKSLDKFKQENSNAVLEASSTDMIRTFGCGDAGCTDTNETSVTSTENNDTCTAVFSEKGKLLSHVHSEK
jgi:hypothetical protein